MNDPEGAWNPDAEYREIAGADTYRIGMTLHLERTLVRMAG
ncbi:MAG: hypothetical protein P8Z37_02120 [Acidobacteriota bacterium]|jgi:hypothetical protein